MQVCEKTELNGRADAATVERLHDRIRLLEAVIDNFPGGISLFDDNLEMVLCNDRQKALLDYSPELFRYGNPSLEQLFRYNAKRGEYGPGEVEAHVRQRMELARLRKPHHYQRTRPDGRVLEVRGMPLEGGGFVTTYLDVTEQHRNQELIAHMAMHDTLTDLPNRALFNDRLGQALATAKRGGAMALLYVDLDRFKPVNDEHGHHIGDTLLKQVADRLCSMVREHDTVARLGGDEFAVVQTRIAQRNDAGILAGRLIDGLAAPFAISPVSISIGASIGIAFAPSDGATPDDLIRKADLAL